MAASEANSQVELLHQISNIVSSSLALEAMLQELIGLAVEVTGCDACLVYLVDHAANEIVLRASQLPHSSEIGHIRMKMGEGITGWVAQHKSVVALAANAAGDARFKTFQALPEDTYEAFLSVPLISNGDLIGVINIHHRAKHPHTPEEIALISFIGEQMGGALERSKLAERSEGAARRMEALASLARTMSEKNYVDRILQAICELVADTLEAPVCSILLVDEDRRELTMSGAWCSSPEHAPRMPMRLEDSMIGRVVREGCPIFVPNLLEDQEYASSEPVRNMGVTSLLSIPLIAREMVIGTLNVYTRGVQQFTDDEMGFVKVVAGQASIAVENARLMSETQEMKRTLEMRKLVERAKGILQRKYNLSEEESYLRLRNESRRLRRPMADLAEAVILSDDLGKKDDGANKKGDLA
ncbi:MAG TPA: GAF domain-containing protein [Bryobacteraceae bacterium]|nr:GAF domain-containing protein [Bryobacteraceae bacterium]